MATQAVEKDVTVAEKGKEPERTGVVRPLYSFEEMERNMEQMIERFFDRRNWWPFHREFPLLSELEKPFAEHMPSVDLIERDDEILVRAEMPGVEKKDLEITVNDNRLTIKGTAHSEQKEEKGEYYRREMRRGTYCRSITLPSSVNGDKAKANFRDGILEITLPRTKPAKRQRIKVG